MKKQRADRMRQKKTLIGRSNPGSLGGGWRMPEAGACIECHRAVRLVIQVGGQTKKGPKKPERYNLPPPSVPSAGAFCGSFPSTCLD